jgi:spermidine synthase
MGTGVGNVCHLSTPFLMPLKSFSGLGAGISATAFNRHGIETTIVEIDPAVYDAARLYFGLPDHPAANLFLEDARAWAARRRASIGSGKAHPLFDIVVHDCFSGGGVPEHIFTVEFWDDLKAALHPEGVVVVVRFHRPFSLFYLIRLFSRTLRG